MTASVRRKAIALAGLSLFLTGNAGLGCEPGISLYVLRGSTARAVAYADIYVLSGAGLDSPCRPPGDPLLGASLVRERTYGFSVEASGEGWLLRFPLQEFASVGVIGVGGRIEESPEGARTEVVTAYDCEIVRPEGQDWASVALTLERWPPE